MGVFLTAIPSLPNIKEVDFGRVAHSNSSVKSKFGVKNKNCSPRGTLGVVSILPSVRVRTDCPECIERPGIKLAWGVSPVRT